MPQVPIIMPQLGESIAEATVVDIKVKPGEEVVVDQEIIDVAAGLLDKLKETASR